MTKEEEATMKENRERVRWKITARFMSEISIFCVIRLLWKS